MNEQAFLEQALLVTDHKFNGDGTGRCAVLVACEASAGAKRCMQYKAQHASPKTARRIDAECVAELIFDEYERIISCEDYGCEHSGDGDQVCWRCRKAIFVRVAWPSILKARE